MIGQRRNTITRRKALMFNFSHKRNNFFPSHVYFILRISSLSIHPPTVQHTSLFYSTINLVLLFSSCILYNRKYPCTRDNETNIKNLFVFLFFHIVAILMSLSLMWFSLVQSQSYNDKIDIKPTIYHQFNAQF